MFTVSNPLIYYVSGIKHILFIYLCKSDNNLYEMGNRVLLFLLSLLYIPACAYEYDIRSALLELDNAVESHQYYVEQHLAKIHRVKRELQYAEFDNDKYLINKKLFRLYKKFDGDSAIAYAQRNYELGVKNNRKDWRSEAELFVAQVHVTRGVLFVAREELDKIGPIKDFPNELQEKLAIVMLNYGSKMRSRQSGAVPVGILAENEQELMSYLRKGTLRYYIGQGMLKNFSVETKLAVENIIRKLNKDDYISLSKAYFTVARCCKNIKDEDGHIYYLAKASVCDMKSVNRGSQALLMLIQESRIQNNVERAYRYAMQCEEDVKAYKDYNRSVDLLSAQDDIIRSYQKAQDRQQRLIVVGLVFLLLLSGVVLLMFFQLRKKAHRLRSLNRQMDSLNQEQKKHLDEISRMKQQLEVSYARLLDEIKLRDNNFIATYYLCSDYVKSLQNFKKSMVNLLKTNSIKEAMRKASSNEINDQELKEFYRRFDEAFLSTHVDFVERFNRLLKPEGQFHLDNQNVLTPELRIYALISLGINNSVNIADFLHYSPQTIYNYRLRVRHQSCIDEKLFAEAVTNIYDDAKLRTYFE